MNSQSLLELLHQQSAPLTAAQAAKALGAKAKDATAALDALANEGKAFAFTQGKSTAYASKRPLDLCADSLAKLVAAQKAALAPAKLKSLLDKGLRAWFDEALGRLIVQGKAWWLPAGKTKLVLGRRVRPSDLLTKAQLAAVQKLLTESNRRRQSPRTVEQFIAWLDGDETKSPCAPTPVTREQLIAWYAEDRKGASSAMIAIPQTWKRYAAWAQSKGQEPDASSFRAALSEMYDAGEAILEPCERPQDLQEIDRQLQVPLSLGPPGYYWRPLDR